MATAGGDRITINAFRHCSMLEGKVLLNVENAGFITRRRTAMLDDLSSVVADDRRMIENRL